MDGLRWLLLISGIVVVVGIYLYGRKKASGPSAESGGGRVEPQLSSDDDIEALADSVSPETEDFVEIEDEPMLVDDEGEPAAEPSPQKIVTLRIVARDRGSFRGDDLILSLRGIGMRHGKFGIFHRIDGDDEEATIFSAASLVEPGSFDLENIKDQSIPGISLFLVLPRTITQALNGELLDESGSTLSIQRERYMREEVIQFEHDNHPV